MRSEEIRRRAFQLARSGFADRAAVRAALEQEGYAEARFVLDDPVVAAHVTGLCSEHIDDKPVDHRRA